MYSSPTTRPSRDPHQPVRPTSQPAFEPRPAHRPTRLPAVGAPAVLLGVGGLLLVIAAIVFLSMSWTALSLGAKVAVLTVVSGLLAGAAATVTNRGLRGSAETLWAITLADLELDLWAARQANLAGLRSMPIGNFSTASSILIGLLALGCCLAARRSTLGRALVTGQLALGLAGLLATASGLATSVQTGWLALSLAVLVLLLLSMAARLGRLNVAAWTWTLGASLPWLGLLISGLVQVRVDRFVPQLWHGQACELPAATALALGAAAIPPLLRVNWARLAAATVGAGLVSFIIAVVAGHRLALPIGLAAATLSVAAISRNRHPIWRPATGLVLMASLAADGLALAGAAATGAAGSIQPVNWLWRLPAGARLAGWHQIPVQSSLVLLAISCLVLIGCRTVLGAPAQLVAWTLGLSAPTAVAIALASGPTTLVATLAWLAVAGCGVALVDRYREPGLLAVAGASLLLGLGCALATGVSSLVGFGTGAALTVLVGWRFAADLAASSAAAGSAVGFRTAFELAGIGQLFVAVAAGWRLVQPAGVGPAVVGLLSCAAVFAVSALLSSTRRWWLWLAAAAVTAAIWTEAVARQLSAPEPYSVSLGLLLLAFAWQATRRTPTVSSWLGYGPGLLVLTGPSLVLALEDPLGWRAAVIGALALAVTLTAVRYRLQAPLLIGAGELALLAIREVGPYALALPRWAAIGAVGLLLLGLGISWENQLANLRAAQRRLAGMR